MIDVKQIVKQTFEECTLLSLDEIRDIPIKDLNVDSYNFISFIVILEKQLKITIPDEYLLFDELPSIEVLSELICNLYNINNN